MESAGVRRVREREATRKLENTPEMKHLAHRKIWGVCVCVGELPQVQKKVKIKPTLI